MALRGTFLLCSFLVSGLLVACNDAADDNRGGVTQEQAANDGACRGPEDCDQGELCVAEEEASSHGRCVDRCSLDDGDVCPVGEYCAAVIGMNGHRDAACVEGEAGNSKSWQRCESADACSAHEDCVELDPTVGPRCVPSCHNDEDCEQEGARCALHWDSDDGAESGCVQQCQSNADCDGGWTCQYGDALSGICVR